MEPKIGILKLNYRARQGTRNSNKGNQGTGKVTRRCVRNRLRTGQDSGSYIEARKGQNKLYRKGGVEATEQG